MPISNGVGGSARNLVKYFNISFIISKLNISIDRPNFRS